MFTITPLDKPIEKKGVLYYLHLFAYRLGNLLEVGFIIFFWWLIIAHVNIFSDFTWQEMVIYLIVGNIISLITNILFRLSVEKEAQNSDARLLLRQPKKYFSFIVKGGFMKFLISFIVLTAIYLFSLQFFKENFTPNFNIVYLSIIVIMVLLAFVIEFLLTYLIRLSVFWTMESSEVYKITMRLKKILSGYYFPLSLLPTMFVNISLTLPFAYSFFVPTQLYLRKISLSLGFKGLFVQSVWIIILYAAVKILLAKRFQTQKK
jgi:ABC-2 type transport system permease protein